MLSDHPSSELRQTRQGDAACGVAVSPANAANFADTEPVRRLTRPRVHGKFLFVGDEKFYVRGVTYGPFRSAAHDDGDHDDDDDDGNTGNGRYCNSEYHDPAVVEADFRQIAATGANAIRTYTPPPLWLLDLAARFGLRVLVGLAWEQHVTFLDDAARCGDIETRLRESVRACAGHPAVLAYAIGNEIPAPVVRWYGARRISRFLERLYWAVKREDSDALVTYVSYPSTEYLELPFLDFLAYNVYLEAPEKLQAYVARLQNLAGTVRC